MKRLLLVVLASSALYRGVASAQDESADALSFPARAGALHPAGTASDRFTWEGSAIFDDEDGFVGLQLVTHHVHVSIPFESFALTLDTTTLAQWAFPGVDDQVVLLTGGNPEVGAHFWDAPHRMIRYRLGVGVALAVSSRTFVDGEEPRPPSHFSIEDVLVTRGLGWDSHRLLTDSLSLVASGFLEITPHPALALSLEVALPVAIGFRGNVLLLPQAAMSLSGRFDDLHLVGLRAEVASSPWRGLAQFNFALELFARLVYADDERALPFVRIAVRAPLGPAHGPLGRSGWAGGSLELGALF